MLHSNVASSVYNSPMHQERIAGVIAASYDAIMDLERENRELPRRVLVVAVFIAALLWGLSVFSTTLTVFVAGAGLYHMLVVGLKVGAAYKNNVSEIRRAKELLDDCQALTDAQVDDLRLLAAQKPHSQTYLESILKERDFVLRGEARVIEEFVALSTSAK